MARKSRKNENAAVAPTPAAKVYSAGAYIRLSAVDRKQKGDSIEVQQTIIADFIAEHADIELTETYIDNGVSGQTLERPAFQRMLADMESGKIDCALCKDLSRLGRSAIDTGYYIEKYFPTMGVRFIAINDDYDSADGNSGGIMISLKNMVNEAYALDIGRKIRTTKQMNIRNGCFVGSVPPYGYLKSPDDNHQLITDSVAAPIVARMFEMAANGDGVSAITRWLNTDDILPPRRYFATVGATNEKITERGSLWNKAVVYAILRNRVYTGDMVQGKGKTYSYDVTRLSKDEWIVTPDMHEPIVSRELFDKVQEVRIPSQTPRCAKTYEELKAENPFLRKVYCGHCGHTMVRRSVLNDGDRTITCNTRNMYGMEHCVPNTIRESELRREMLTLIQKQAVVFADKQKLAASQATHADTSGEEIRTAQAELDRNGNFLKGLYESLVASDITEQEYRELKRSYETRIGALTDKIKRLKTADRERRLKAAEMEKAADNFSAAIGISELTPELIDALIERITVFEGKRIEVTFKFAVDFIETEISEMEGADND
jgi:DNA invertase Pin-like site-specific DNA recombinase